MTDTGPMTKADRDGLIRIARNRAKQAEHDVDARRAFLYAETIDLLTAEFEANDRLWADAVIFATEQVEKTNAQIRTQCESMGIPPQHAPSISTHWITRGPSFSDRERRNELKELAKVRLDALAKEAKVQIQMHTLAIEEQLILDGLESGQAREFLASMPTVEALMPKLGIEDLGVTRWQPPENIAAQLTTPQTPAQRKARRIRRAIAANPGASNRAIAEIAGCDHKTIANYRAAAADGELPAIDGEIPDDDDAAS